MFAMKNFASCGCQ